MALPLLDREADERDAERVDRLLVDPGALLDRLAERVVTRPTQAAANDLLRSRQSEIGDCRVGCQPNSGSTARIDWCVPQPLGGPMSERPARAAERWVSGAPRLTATVEWAG